MNSEKQKVSGSEEMQGSSREGERETARQQQNPNAEIPRSAPQHPLQKGSRKQGVKGEHSRWLGVVFPEHLATTARPSRRGKHDTEGNGVRAVIKQNKTKTREEERKLLRGARD